MALQHLDSSPVVGDFTPLQEHQEQTPATFFGAKPVLYSHYSNLTLSIPAEKIHSDPVFAKFSANANAGAADEDVFIRDVEIWVNTQDLILFQTNPTPTGISIPYSSIALHATMKYRSTATEALYMNISLNDPETVNNEDDIQILELTILPPDHDAADPSTNIDTTCIRSIYQAMNTCADLHPDPNDESAEEGDLGFDETAPGATGWITADNMDDFMDEEGNSRGDIMHEGEGEPLGLGAGHVRSREHEEEEDINGVNGTDGETKWQRTD